jgi:GNAT superfamily N-acetyltransferase
MSERGSDGISLAAEQARAELRGTPYRLALLRGRELEAVLPLFADAFPGRQFTADRLARKYACTYENVRGFLCVAFTETGDVAGSVGLLPWAVRYRETKEGAGQMVDVATHSAHRGRGLFVHLADAVRDVCDRAGLGFLFGFPNEEAYPIWINKLGYRHTDDLVQYRRSVGTLWIERVTQRVGPLASWYGSRVDHAFRSRAPNDPVLPNSLGTEGFACIDRDASFHAYKTAFAGGRVVTFGGGRVWLRVQHGMLIGDLEAQSADELDTTVHELTRLARRLGVHQLVFQASKDTRFSSLLRSRFEESPGLPVIHLDIRSRIPADRLRYTFGDLDNF